MFAPTVVFVDDEPHVLSTITRSLRGHHLSVKTFGDAQEALAFLASTAAAVVVSDYRMPAMDGIEFLSRAAAIQPEAARILLTGYADLQTAVAAINRGAVSCFLSKPWDEADLLGAVLDQVATSTIERLLASLPAYQARLLDLQDPEAMLDALGAFLRETAGIELAGSETDAPGGVAGAAETIAVSAGGAAVRLCLAAPHVAVFRNRRLLGRLRDLLLIAARTSLLAASGRRLAAELLTLSQTDALSGVSNRRAFDRELAREVDRSVRYGSPLSMMLIDIDRFKGINDSYGHQAGDAVIEGVGRALRKVTRSTDIAARYGGDEFAIILPGLDAQQAARAAARIRGEAAQIPHPGGAGERLTLSIGVAAWSEGLDVPGLLAQADQGVYRVKEGGRDGIAVSPPDSPRTGLDGDPRAGLEGILRDPTRGAL